MPRLRSSATSLIRKGRRRSHARKVGQIGRDDLFFVFASAAFHLTNRHDLDLGPHASHERHHAPIAAHRHTFRRWLLGTGAQWLRLLVLALKHALPDRQRLPTSGRGMHHHPERPLQVLDGSPKRQFAAHVHQRVQRMWQQMSIRHLQFLIQGEKN